MLTLYMYISMFCINQFYFIKHGGKRTHLAGLRRNSGNQFIYTSFNTRRLQLLSKKLWAMLWSARLPRMLVNCSYRFGETGKLFSLFKKMVEYQQFTLAKYPQSIIGSYNKLTVIAHGLKGALLCSMLVSGTLIIIGKDMLDVSLQLPSQGQSRVGIYSVFSQGQSVVVSVLLLLAVC